MGGLLPIPRKSPSEIDHQSDETGWPKHFVVTVSTLGNKVTKTVWEEQLLSTSRLCLCVNEMREPTKKRGCGDLSECIDIPYFRSGTEEFTCQVFSAECKIIISPSFYKIQPQCRLLGGLGVGFCLSLFVCMFVCV